MRRGPLHFLLLCVCVCVCLFTRYMGIMSLGNYQKEGAFLLEAYDDPSKFLDPFKLSSYIQLEWVFFSLL